MIYITVSLIAYSLFSEFLCDCFGPRIEMLSVILSSNAFIFFHLLVTTTYAFPAYPQLVSPLVADRHNVSSPNMLDNLNVNRIPSTEALNLPPEPVWSITCETEPFTHRPVIGTDCLQIATQIENSAGATAYHLYKASDPGLGWRNGGCYIFLDSMLPTDTDVFRPISIALNIRRVVEKCDTLGGATAIGPRRKFDLFIEPWDVDSATTVATARS